MEAWIIWGIVALIAVLIEVLTLGFAVLCFAVGAAVASVAAYLGIGLAWQLALFSLFTLVAMVAVRPFFIRYFKRSKQAAGVETNINALVGRRAVVSSDFVAGEGRVRVDGDDWKAIIEGGDNTLSVGEKVEVERVESVILIVKKV